MKALSILGTSSNAGKSWVATAFCALLRRRGLRVAPFKAQNMSNNSYVTLEGGEIGRAQAAQAEAAGLRPVAAMNPILLKPSGDSTSQLVLLGQAGPHLPAGSYYRETETLWATVEKTLEGWKSRCDVLVLEGAGSPVELNLMDRDLVNLRPCAHLDGRWVLVCDIERGGVFAQAHGTVQLMPEADRQRGAGLIVNKFRGDLGLFATAAAHFEKIVPTPYLGVLPFRRDLQPESEDSLSTPSTEGADGALLAWVRFPRLSNGQDCEPWLNDSGVRVGWAEHPHELKEARAVVLPGSKDTMSDLRWLRAQGLDQAILRLAAQGVPIVGICGGYQMMGESLSDPDGLAGAPGEEPGLGLLPLRTRFQKTKQVTQVEARWGDSAWMAYEIHMGQTEFTRAVAPLLTLGTPTGLQRAGVRQQNLWGTYLHGLFESPAVRRDLAQASQITDYVPSGESWAARKARLYDAMADLLAAQLDLTPIYRYVDA